MITSRDIHDYISRSHLEMCMITSRDHISRYPCLYRDMRWGGVGGGVGTELPGGYLQRGLVVVGCVCVVMAGPSFVHPGAERVRGVHVIHFPAAPVSTVMHTPRLRLSDGCGGHKVAHQPPLAPVLSSFEAMGMYTRTTPPTPFPAPSRWWLV